MRIAMIGAGYMGTLHASAWAHLDDVSVGWVVGRALERASSLAARLGARASTDLRAALDDSSVEAVDITAPTSAHPALVQAALDAGKHVFCETPLARTPEAAEQMTTQAAARGRHLQVALLHRFAKQNLFFRDSLRAGAFGPALTVSAIRRAPGTGGAHHGDAIEELMLFDLDILRWTLGDADVIGASAFRDDSGSVRQAVALLEFDGVSVSVEASFLLPRSHSFEARLFAACEEGALEGAFSAPLDGPPVARCTQYPASGTATEDTDLGEDPILAECRRFAAVVRGEADPGHLSGRNAVAALRLAEDIRAAID